MMAAQLILHRCAEVAFRLRRIACMASAVGVILILSCGGEGGELFGSSGRGGLSTDPSKYRTSLETTLPMTDEEAAMLNALRADTVSAAIDGEAFGAGLRGEIRSKVQGGVLHRGEPIPLPGAPPRSGASTSTSLDRLSDVSGFGFYAVVPVEDAIGAGDHKLVLKVIDPDLPNIPLLQLELGITVDPQRRMENLPLEKKDVLVPGANRSGLSNLLQLFAKEEDPSLGLDPSKDRAPLTTAEIDRVLENLAAPMKSAAREMGEQFNVETAVDTAELVEDVSPEFPCGQRRRMVNGCWRMFDSEREGYDDNKNPYYVNITQTVSSLVLKSTLEPDRTIMGSMEARCISFSTAAESVQTAFTGKVAQDTMDGDWTRADGTAVGQWKAGRASSEFCSGL